MGQWDKQKDTRWEGKSEQKNEWGAQKWDNKADNSRDSWNTRDDKKWSNDNNAGQWNNSNANDDLVKQVKDVQRLGISVREAWEAYCDELGVKKDPARMDADGLQAFLD